MTNARKPANQQNNHSPGENRHSEMTATPDSYPSGTPVFGPERGHGNVYFVRTGCARLFKSLPNGREINLGILGPHTFFTQEDTATDIASGTSAVSMVDSTISVVQIDELSGVIAASPDLAASLVIGMTRRLTEVQTLVEHLLVRDMSVRLAATLLNLATKFGRPGDDGMTVISLPLNHLALANMVGSNRVTVTRKLEELQRQQLVRSHGRSLFAVDTAGLRNCEQSATVTPWRSGAYLHPATAGQIGIVATPPLVA